LLGIIEGQLNVPQAISKNLIIKLNTSNTFLPIVATYYGLVECEVKYPFFLKNQDKIQRHMTLHNFAIAKCKKRAKRSNFKFQILSSVN
jgi:hypothetical protein